MRGTSKRARTVVAVAAPALLASGLVGTMKVPGVRAVESFLHLPGEPAPNKATSLSAIP